MAKADIGQQVVIQTGQRGAGAAAVFPCGQLQREADEQPRNGRQLGGEGAGRGAGGHDGSFLC